MKRFVLCLVFLAPFTAHADDYDPTALHDRGSQELIGNLEVVGKVTADEIATPSGVSIGGTSSCQAGQTCVTDGALDKMNTINALRDILGVGLADAKKIIENASEPKIVGGIYEEFTVDWGCTGNHNGAFGAGSVVVCGNDLANGGIVAPRIKTDELTAKSLSASNSLNAFNATIENWLTSNFVNVRTNITANSAQFARAPVIPLVRYGLEIHAEYSGEIPVCTEEQSAAFVEAIQIFIENNLPEAPLIAYECGRWFSIISPVMLEDFPTAKMTVFNMFDGVLIKHYIPNYYEDQGGAFQKMSCGADGRGAIAVAVDAKGAALVDCRVEEGQGTIYRRYAPESTIKF